MYASQFAKLMGYSNPGAPTVYSRPAGGIWDVADLLPSTDNSIGAEAGGGSSGSDDVNWPTGSSTTGGSSSTGGSDSTTPDASVPSGIDPDTAKLLTQVLKTGGSVFNTIYEGENGITKQRIQANLNQNIALIQAQMANTRNAQQQQQLQLQLQALNGLKGESTATTTKILIGVAGIAVLGVVLFASSRPRQNPRRNPRRSPRKRNRR